MLSPSTGKGSEKKGGEYILPVMVLLPAGEGLSCVSLGTAAGDILLLEGTLRETVAFPAMPMVSPLLLLCSWHNWTQAKLPVMKN
jgi:hypothetical protein